MQMLPTFGVTRRGRRRLAAWRLLTLTALGTALVAGMLASYRVGLSQGRTEALRLEADLKAAHEFSRAMSERVAAAEQQAEAAITRAAQLQQLQRNQAPSPELQRLMSVATAQLGAGLAAERLEFVLRQAAPDRACAKEVDSRRMVVHTPLSTGSIASAGFADNRIVVTGEGAVARAPDGTAAARYDPAQPVTLRFLRNDGDVATATGRLPLAHAVVLGNTEYRFSIQASQQQPEAVELSAQRCPFP